MSDVDEERQAVLRRLEAISSRHLDDRSLTPGEARTIIGWIGHLQLDALEQLAKSLSARV